MTSAVDPQQCIAAEALLYRTLAVVDPVTGQLRTQRIETAGYRDCCERRAAFAAARAVYSAAYNESQTTVHGRRAWPLAAMSLQLPVDAAMNRMRAAVSAPYEQAEALLERAAAESRRGHA